MQRSYKHLTLEMRYTIEQLLKKQYSLKEISGIIDVNRSTIYRELSRNKTYKGNYVHYTAHNKYKKRLKKKGIKPILATDTSLRTQILKYLKDSKWSPEQIVGRLKLQYDKEISLHTIYRYIANNKSNGGKLYTNLRHPLAKSKSKRKHNKKAINDIIGKKSIEIRPPEVDKKEIIGDWEGDLVEVSKKEYLVTLTDRHSKLLIADKVKSKNAEEVAESIIDSLFKLKDSVKTITFDNGGEFSLFRRMEEQLDTAIYFAHPYSSWERGLNEHTNGLIRQFVPKRGKQKINHISYKTLEKIENLLNNRPRKVLGYRTPNEVFYGINNIKCCT